MERFLPNEAHEWETMLTLYHTRLDSVSLLLPSRALRGRDRLWTLSGG